MQTISNSITAREKPPARVQLHGVLVRVHESGVLLLGESGTGKSDCALELILEGHRLVADDSVVVSRTANTITGSAPSVTRDLLAIRGLGIVNVREVFGESALETSSRIDLCIEILENAGLDGVIACEGSVVGRRLPKFVVTPRSPRQLASFVETVARLLHAAGRNTPPAEWFSIKQTELFTREFAY